MNPIDLDLIPGLRRRSRRKRRRKKIEVFHGKGS
jgi:hypothetical protein